LMTFQEFLDWADEDTHAEWVDGRVILLHVTVRERHEAIRGFLHWLFYSLIRSTRQGAVYGEPFQMWLPLLNRSRAPDIFFVREESRFRVGEHYLQGPADIAVEILSPESEARDRVEKLNEYQQAGVSEYWVIDHQTRRAEFHVLGADGRYALAFAGETGLYQSSVLPQMGIKVEWLWQEPPGADPEDLRHTLGFV
jgi:Uma2 family endonuclease